MNEDLKADITDPLLRAVIDGLANARSHVERELLGLDTREKAERITTEFADKILTALHYAGLLRRNPFEGKDNDLALAVILSRERFPFDPDPRKGD